MHLNCPSRLERNGDSSHLFENSISRKKRLRVQAFRSSPRCPENSRGLAPGVPPLFYPLSRRREKRSTPAIFSNFVPRIPNPTKPTVTRVIVAGSGTIRAGHARAYPAQNKKPKQKDQSNAKRTFISPPRTRPNNQLVKTKVQPFSFQCECTNF